MKLEIKKIEYDTDLNAFTIELEDGSKIELTNIDHSYRVN